MVFVSKLKFKNRNAGFFQAAFTFLYNAVGTIVSSGGQPIPVPDYVVSYIQQRLERLANRGILDAPFKKGEVVQVAKGPLEGLEHPADGVPAGTEDPTGHQGDEVLKAGAGEALAKTGEQRHQNRRYKVHGLSPGACAVVQPHASVGKPLFVSSRAAPTGDENRQTLG